MRQDVKICDVSLEHIIHSETMAVMAAMRRNSRWATRTVRRTVHDDMLADTMGLRRTGQSVSNSHKRLERQESDLLGGFEDLNRIIRDTEGVYNHYGPLL